MCVCVKMYAFRILAACSTTRAMPRAPPRRTAGGGPTRCVCVCVWMHAYLVFSGLTPQLLFCRPRSLSLPRLRHPRSRTWTLTPSHHTTPLTLSHTRKPKRERNSTTASAFVYSHSAADSLTQKHILRSRTSLTHSPVRARKRDNNQSERWKRQTLTSRRRKSSGSRRSRGRPESTAKMTTSLTLRAHSTLHCIIHSFNRPRGRKRKRSHTSITSLTHAQTQQQRALEEADFDLAEAEKFRLEEKQRAARKYREENHISYSPKWFEPRCVCCARSRLCATAWDVGVPLTSLTAHGVRR